MPLKRTPVSRCLDKKLKLLGFEIPDLLAIVSIITVLNFVFGESPIKLYVVWVPSAGLAAVLYFGKKGKPENYLVHWVRFQIKPGIHSAFRHETERPRPPRLRKD